jgi:hypothetical protein
MSFAPQQIERALQLLGLTRADLDAPLREAAPAAQRERLEQLQVRVKGAFRRVALELHPDRTGNDPVKTEEFKVVSCIAEEIANLKLVPRPRPVPRPVPVYPGRPVMFGGFTTFGFGGFSGTSTTTTTCSGPGWTWVKITLG